MAPSKKRVRAVVWRHPEDGPGTESGNDQGAAGGTGSGAGDELGAGGQAALAAERKARRDAEKAAKAVAEERDRLKAEADELRAKAMTDDEKKIAAAVEAAREQMRQEIEAETAAKVAEADRRVLAARVLSVATGKLTNPADAQAFIKFDDLERDAQGNVTDAALSAAIEALVKERPYLAAKAGAGSADQGPRRDAAPDFTDRKQLAAELAKLGLKPRG
jgi:hypothetical protein